MGRWLGRGVAVVAAVCASVGPQSAIADTAGGVTVSAVALEVLEPGQAAIVVGAMPTGSELKAGGARLRVADHRLMVRAGRWVAVVGGGQALARVYGGSLFGGDVTFGRASASVRVGGDPASTTETSLVSHLKLFGRPVDLQPGASVALGDWGSLTLDGPSPSGGAATNQTRAAITIDVTTEHAGLPAGTQVIIATVEVTSPTTPSPPPPPSTTGSGGVGGGDRGGLGGASGGSRRNHKQPGGSHPSPSPPPARRHPAFPHRRLATHPRILPAQARLRIVAWAASQIGWPYVWGGDGQAEGGFDCSGLVDFAYASAGFPLPGRPTAQVLWQLSQPIRRAQLRPGDLVFLRAASGYAYHVAMYAGGGQVIVASHHGAPVARQPLTTSPWDAYGRIWTHGSLQPTPDLTTAHSTGQRPTPRHVLPSSGDTVTPVAPAPTATITESPQISAPRSPHNPPRRGSTGQPQTWGEPRPPHPGIAANPRRTH